MNNKYDLEIIKYSATLKEIKEIKELESMGISIFDRLYISKATHIVLPWYKDIDKKKDKWKGGEELQTLKLEEMPKYIIENYQWYKPWLDNT